MTKNKFQGTGVALVTPFRTDGDIDFNSFDKLINHVISNGVNYLVVLGTTGEAATQSKDEACAIINFVIEKVEKRVPIILGIGGNNTRQVVNNIKKTDWDNLDGLLSVSPYYNKPTQSGIYAHYKEIANESPVPIIIYNVPGRTGSNISADTTLRLAHDFSNIIATKEASGNMEQAADILRNKPEEFMLISGDDAIALPLIAMGATGLISVIGNALPKHTSDLVNYSLQGDFTKARDLNNRLSELIPMLFTEGNPGGIKAALDILGICSNNLRLPLVPVSKEHYAKIEKCIKNIPSVEKIVRQLENA